MKVIDYKSIRFIEDDLESEARQKYPELFKLLDSVRKKDEHEFLVLCTPYGVSWVEIPEEYRKKQKG
jgi:hypothetical protein